MRHRASTVARRAATSVAALFVISVATPAGASVKPAATGQENLTSGTWGVVPTQSTSSPPPTGPLTITTTKNGAIYFQVVNDGSVTIGGMSYAVTISSAKTTAALTACSVAWNQSGGGTCPGSSTTVGTWIDSSPPGPGRVTSGATLTSSTVPASNTAELYLRATLGGVPGTGSTITFDTSVSSGAAGQIRAGQTTNA